jgi:DNA-binding NarL/FixJ family response regulator
VPTEIIVVDDQELVRLGFRMVINSQSDLKVTGGPALRDSARSRRDGHLRRISDAMLPPVTTIHRTAKLGARTTEGFAIESAPDDA